MHKTLIIPISRGKKTSEFLHSHLWEQYKQRVSSLKLPHCVASFCQAAKWGSGGRNWNNCSNCGDSRVTALPNTARRSKGWGRGSLAARKSGHYPRRAFPMWHPAWLHSTLQNLAASSSYFSTKWTQSPLGRSQAAKAHWLGPIGLALASTLLSEVTASSQGQGAVGKVPRIKTNQNKHLFRWFFWPPLPQR